MPSLGHRLHGPRLAVELDLNLPVRWRPKAEAHLAIGLQLGAEGHAVHARRGLDLHIEKRQDAPQWNGDPLRSVGEFV